MKTQLNDVIQEMNQPKVFSFDIFTSLTENLRYKSEVEGFKTLVNVEKPDGEIELFFINQDQMIGHYYPDAKSETGYTCESLGLLANQMIAFTKDDVTYVCYSEGTSIYYIKEEHHLSYKYTKQIELNIDCDFTRGDITSVFMTTYQDQNKKPSIFIGITINDLSSNRSKFLYSVWNGEKTRFVNTTYFKDFEHCNPDKLTWYQKNNILYLLKTDGLIAFPVYPTGSAAYITLKYPSGLYDCKKFTLITDPKGNNQKLIGLFEDQKLYMEGSYYQWHPLNTTSESNEHYIDITSCLDKRIMDKQEYPANHIFAITTNHELFHTSISDRCNDISLVPIEDKVTQVILNQSNQGSLSAILCGENGASLELINQSFSTDIWNTHTVAQPNYTDFETFRSYTSEISLFDEAGIPITATKFKLLANEKTLVYINHKIDMLSPNSMNIYTTNEMGKLVFAQEIDSFSAPNILIELLDDSIGDSDQAVPKMFALSQYKDIQKSLEHIEANDLMNATKNDGTNLLEDTYRTKEYTEPIANAIRDCMSYMPDKNHDIRSSQWLSQRDVYQIGRLELDDSNSGWMIAVGSDGALEYRSLSEREILQENQIEGVRDFFRGIGNFFKSVAKKAIQISAIIFKKIGNTIKVGFDYFIGIAKKTVEFIIGFAQQIIDVALSIFDMVKVFFEDVFEWLAFIFNWNDILETKEAIKYVTQKGLESIENTVDELYQIVSKGINFAKDKVEGLFDLLISKIDEQTTIAQLYQGNVAGLPPASPNESLANNILLNRMTEDICDETVVLGHSAIDTSMWDDLLKVLEEYGKNIMNTEAFGNAMAYFEDACTSRDEFFSNALKGLVEIVKGLAMVAFDTIQLVIDAFFVVIRHMLKAMSEMINGEIKLPFISTLYKKISGSALTLGDCTALIAAVPVNIIYKLAKGVAPFRHGTGDLDQFKKILDELFRRPLLHGSDKVLAVSPEGIELANFILGILDGIVSFCYYVLANVSDGLATIKMPVSVGKVDIYEKIEGKVALAAWIFEIIWMYNSLAGLILEAATTIEKEVIYFFRLSQFVFESLLGVFIDEASILGSMTLSDSANDAVIVTSAMFTGAVPMAICLMATILEIVYYDGGNNTSEIIAYVSSFMPSFLSATKFLFMNDLNQLSINSIHVPLPAFIGLLLDAIVEYAYPALSLASTLTAGDAKVCKLEVDKDSIKELISIDDLMLHFSF